MEIWPGTGRLGLDFCLFNPDLFWREFPWDTMQLLPQISKLVLLLCTQLQILCRGKHFAQNMYAIAFIYRVGERQWEMERDTHTRPFWGALLQSVPAQILAESLIAFWIRTGSWTSAGELQVQKYAAVPETLPHSKSRCKLNKSKPRQHLAPPGEM